MQLIFQTVFGSRLYGTALPTSDHDLKGVFLPTADEILLGNPPKGWTAPAKLGVDSEAYSLSRFLELLAQGQTVALDMLFASPDMWRSMDPIWYDIQRNQNRILNKRCAAAIGYARAQAEKYSLRGSRITALDAIVEVLRGDGNPLRGGRQLQDVLFERGGFIKQLPASSQQYIRIDTEPDAQGSKFLEVCGKKIGLNCSAYLALQTYEKLLSGYGDRSKASQHGGADWKALYHAVRVTDQTIELLETGNITFPRPNADYLLKIRLGEFAPEFVYDRIEEGIERIDAAQAVSELPDEPDREFINDLIIKLHREVIDNG